MPPLPSVLKTIRATFQMNAAPNSRMFCRIFFQYSGVVSFGDLTTLCTTIRTAFQTNVMPQLWINATLTNVNLTDLNSNTGFVVNQASTQAGGVTGAVNPNGVAFVIQSHILRRYRGSHARTYLPAVPNSALADGSNLTATAKANLQTAWGNFINAAILNPPAAVGTLTPVQVSYFSGFTNVTSSSGRTRPKPTLRVTPLVEAIQTATVNTKVGSQRRRNLQSL